MTKRVVVAIAGSFPVAVVAAVSFGLAVDLGGAVSTLFFWLVWGASTYYSVRELEPKRVFGRTAVTYAAAALTLPLTAAVFAITAFREVEDALESSVSGSEGALVSIFTVLLGAALVEIFVIIAVIVGAFGVVTGVAAILLARSFLRRQNTEPQQPAAPSTSSAGTLVSVPAALRRFVTGGLRQVRLENKATVLGLGLVALCLAAIAGIAVYGILASTATPDPTLTVAPTPVPVLPPPSPAAPPVAAQPVVSTVTPTTIRGTAATQVPAPTDTLTPALTALAVASLVPTIVRTPTPVPALTALAVASPVPTGVQTHITAPAPTARPQSTPVPALAGTAPAQPSNVRYALEGSATTLSWDTVADADHYNVYHDDFFDSGCRLNRDGSASMCEELATNMTDNTYVHADRGGGTYYYWVSACNSSGCSDIDSANPAMPIEAIPETPSNTSYAWEGGTIRVRWDAVDGADYYNVYHDDDFADGCRLDRDGSTGFCVELAADVAETSYVHAEPDSDANYYWLVACNRGGCSDIDSANPATPP